MAKNDTTSGTQPGREGVISIIGPGMKVVGDCATEGTLRVEGTVEGTVRAGKAVVVGKEGVVDGDIITQDAVVGGRVNGSVRAESRLELQATCVVEGTIQARRIKLEEGGTVNGTIEIGQTEGTTRRGPPTGERAGKRAAAPAASEGGGEGEGKGGDGKGDGEGEGAGRSERQQGGS